MKSQSIDFSIAEAPISVSFDPDETILKEVVSRKP
jgi:hypothetical protein